MKKFLVALTVFFLIVTFSFATDIKYVSDFDTQVNYEMNLLKKYDVITDEDEKLTNVFLGFGQIRGAGGRDADFLKYFENMEEYRVVAETIEELCMDLLVRADYSDDNFMEKYATRHFDKQKDSLLWKIMYDKKFFIEDPNGKGQYKYARCGKDTSENLLRLGLMFTIDELSSGKKKITYYTVIIDSVTYEVALLKKSAII